MSPRARQSPFFRSLRRLRGAFWRRRVARWLVRTVWVALLIPTVFLAGYLWLGWQVRWYYWAFPMLMIILISLIWALRPISLNKMVHRLDNRLGLQTRLVTGFEASHLSAPSAGANNPVVQRLLQEAVNISVNVRRRVHTLNHSLWLEMQALIAVAALLSGLLMLDALNPRVPNAEAVALPEPWQEPRAAEVIQPDPQLFPPPFPPEMQARAMMSPEQVQAALEALADALRDGAATHSIAESIDRGDLAGAAEGLRRLADQLGELSEEARRNLGESLQEAADQIGEDAPDLNRPLEAGGDALGQENLTRASQAMEDLADALDALDQSQAEETAQAQAEENQEGESGEAGQSQGEESVAQAPQQQREEESQSPAEQGGAAAESGGEGVAEEGDGTDQPTEEERLSIEGEPLELESDPELEDRVLQPSELDAAEGDERTSDSPFARQPSNASVGKLGRDPLVYPWDKREVIRSYFTP